MKRKKEDYFVIGLGVTLVLIIFMIAFIVSKDTKTDNGETVGIPIPTPTAIPNSDPRPTNEAYSNPPVLYDSAAQDKIVAYVKDRQPLSDTDRLAKAKMLALLPEAQMSGVIHETQNIRIDYTKSADVFQVEILTTDVPAAKNEANIWLRTRGLSQEAICKLPIGFYLNYDIANELRGTGYVFNPQGNGC